MNNISSKDYYLLQTLSDEPVRLTIESLDKLLGKEINSSSFSLVPNSCLVDVIANEKISNYALNFISKIQIGVIKSSFLETLLPFKKALKYMQLSRIFFKEGNTIKDTGFLLYKANNIIYTRAKATSMFKPSENNEPTTYVPDGKEYITHIPSIHIPIYGTQLRGQLIVREDILEPVLTMKKFAKLHIAKLKIQKPTDGFEFHDSIAL
jgi:hypothetical protein